MQLDIKKTGKNIQNLYFKEMKKIIIFFIIFLFSSLSFASDEKLERYFEDQPDVTDEPQVHFISVSYTHLTLPTKRIV